MYCIGMWEQSFSKVLMAPGLMARMSYMYTINQKRFQRMKVGPEACIGIFLLGNNEKASCISFRTVQG